MKITFTSTDGSNGQVDIPDDIGAEARRLPHDPGRYFLLTPNTVALPLASLVRTRARVDGIKNAVTLMQAAYNGLQSRRSPISVVPTADRRFLVADGNSTVTVAALAGWPDIPCIIGTGEGSIE